MSLEYCDICDEPTGNAGIMDDSYQCVICEKIICSNCGEKLIDKSDGNSEWVCNICLRDQ